MHAFQVFTRDPGGSVPRGTRCVDHRAVVSEQVVVRHMATHLDTEVHRDVALAGCAFERRRDGLGSGVVGGDTRTDQSVWGHGPVVEVDLDAAVLEQLPDRVHRGGAGADDRHPDPGEVMSLSSDGRTASFSWGWTRREVGRADVEIALLRG